MPLRSPHGILALAVALAVALAECEPEDASLQFPWVGRLLDDQQDREAAKCLESMVLRGLHRPEARRMLIDLYEHRLHDPSRAEVHRESGPPPATRESKRRRPEESQRPWTP